MSTRGALAVIAGIVLALGVVLAFLPVSIDDGDIDCGAALQLSASQASAEDMVNGGDHLARCEDRVGTQRLFAFPLVGVGALGLLFLGLTSPRARSDR
jgi:hypothetical protein